MSKDNKQKPSSTEKRAKTKPQKQASAELVQKISELTEALQRERADADNIRKRADDDRIAALASGKEIAIMQLMPLIDNLGRAFAHAPEDIADNTWVKGILGLEKQLGDITKDFGLEKIATVGEEFNPELMEAVSVDEQGGDTEMVSEELQAGFTLNGKVIRVAMVKVTR